MSVQKYGEIYQLIIDLANRGKVVIVVSSEMPELLGICDRIMVMSGGRLAGEINAEEATQELIMTYALKYVPISTKKRADESICKYKITLCRIQSTGFRRQGKSVERRTYHNAIYLLISIAVIYTHTQNSRFLSVASIVNIISLSAANIPIACGIAGTIVLTGTDLSAGRVVGLTACISASLLQSITYFIKIFQIFRFFRYHWLF